MKLTTRCGAASVDGLNEALPGKAAAVKLLRTEKHARVTAAGGATRTRSADPRRGARRRALRTPPN
jgi:hypothetical protein